MCGSEVQHGLHFFGDVGKRGGSAKEIRESDCFFNNQGEKRPIQKTFMTNVFSFFFFLTQNLWRMIDQINDVPKGGKVLRCCKNMEIWWAP